MPSDEPNEPSGVQELIADFLEAERRGDAVDRDLLIRSHPEQEASLRAFFANHDRMKSAAAIGDLGTDAGDTADTGEGFTDDVTIAPQSHAIDGQSDAIDGQSTAIDGQSTAIDGQSTAIDGQSTAIDEQTLPPDSIGLDDATMAGSPPDRAASKPMVGDRVRYFGDYELLEEIARGGMGVVFKAKQTNLNRIVALKMILAGQFAGEEDVQRFYTEAEAAAQLDHPGIVPIFEIGEHSGQHYFSMGYIEGESLAARTADGPLPPDQAARLLAQISEAMAYAHERGVIHRDLKPANILLDLNDQAKVTDFGLAKRTEADSGLTGTGQILGTPSYMPPEQASGAVDDVGPLADVYALGAILYCTLTGRPPFQAASPMDTLLQVIEKDPLAPKQLNPDIDEDLQTICMKCLEKDPERRYASSRDLLEEVNRYLAGEPIHARPIGRLERGWRWCKRKPALAGLFAVAASLLLVLSIGGPMIAIQQSEFARRQVELKSDAEEARDDAKDRQLEAEQSRAEAVAAKREVEREQERVAGLLYATRISLAHREVLNGNSKRAQQLLLECPRESRNWEWHYLDELTRPEDLTIFAHRVPASVKFLPSGEGLITQGIQDGKFIFWDVETGLEINSQKVPGLRSVTAPIDDDHILVVQGPGAAYISSKDPKMEVFGNFGVQAKASSLFKEGKRVAVAFDDGTIVLYERPPGKEKREQGKEIFRTPVKIKSEQPHAFSPSARLVASNEGLLVKVSDVATGEVRFEVEGHGMALQALAFSPDESLLASVDRAGRVILTEVETGQRKQIIQAHAGGVRCVAFDAAGKRIVTGGMNRTCKIFDVVSGSELLTLRGHTAAILGVDFNPAGDKIATASLDGTVRVWSIEKRINPSPEVVEKLEKQQIAHLGHSPGLESTIFYSSALPLYDAVFSPDGRYLASTAFRIGDTAGEKMVQVWSVDDASIHASFPVAGGYLHTLAYSADGKYLIVTSGGAGDGVMPASVKIWDLETKEEFRTIDGVSCMLTRAALNQANDILAVSFGNLTYGKIRSYSFPELELINERDFSGERLSAISFSADGDELMSASAPGGNVNIWNARTDEDLGKFAAHGFGVFQIAVSSDDVLATANTDGTIGIWDWRKQELLGELKGHSLYAVDIDFSPDGSRLVSASEDETVKVWDLKTFSELMSFNDHIGPVLSTDWSNDGTSIASASRDGALIVHRLENKREIEPIDEWVTIFEDQFDREDFGPTWISAAAKIENGKLVGTLIEIPAGGSTFAASFNVLNAIDMPRTVDIGVDVTLRQPMLAQLVLTNRQTQQYIAPFIASTTKPYGFIGSQVQVARGEGINNKTLGSSSDVKLEVGKSYRMRVIREIDQLKFFLDDRLLSHVRVPTMEADLLQLSGTHSEVGDQIEFDNLVIRIPRSAQRKQEIRGQVRQWMTTLLLPELVSEKIEQVLEDDSERELANNVLNSMSAGREGIRDELIDAITAVATRSDATEEEYKIAATQAKHVLRRPGPADSSLPGKIALALVRAGETEQSLELLEEAINGGIDNNGYPDALAIAARALAYIDQGEMDKAKADHQRVRDLNHTWWPPEDQIPELLKELQAKAPLPDLPVRKRLVDMILKMDRAIFNDGDTQTKYELVAPDYVLTFGRSEKPDAYDRSFKKEDAKKFESVISAFAPMPFQKLIWDPIRFHRDDDRITIRIVQIFKESEEVYRFAHLYEFEKRETWQAVKQRTWQIDSRWDGTWTRNNKKHYDDLDRTIAAGLDDKLKLAQKMFLSSRFDDANQLLEKIDPTDEAGRAEKLSLRGEIAVNQGRFTEGLQFLEDAWRADPEVQLPWFFSRRIATFTDWESNPYGLSLHPTKPLMVAAYQSKKVVLWDLESGKKVRTIERAHGDWATDVVFSKDGSKFYAVGFDAVLNVFDTETGERLSQHGGHLGRIYRIERHPEKNVVVTAAADRTAKIWDMDTGKELVSLAGHGAGVMGATFSPDASQVATASADGTVRLWDASTGKELAKIDAHPGGAWRVDYTPDGERLVTCGRDQQVRVWNAADQSEIATLKGHRTRIEVVRVSPDGKMAASADEDGDLRVWDLAELKPIAVLHDTNVNYAIHFQGKTIFSAGDDINQWDIDFSRSPLLPALKKAESP